MLINKQNNTKVVLLAGVTILAGATDANAGVITSAYETFELNSFTFVTDNDSVSFASFDTALGALTGVTLDLSSFISSSEASEIFAALSINGVQISSYTYDDNNPVYDFSFTGIDGTGGGAIPLSFFAGNGVSTFSVALSLNAGRADPNCNSVDPFYCTGDGANWYGNNSFDNQYLTNYGLRVNYEYTVPLPATLSLFAIGLAGLGIRQRRRPGKESRTPS